MACTFGEAQKARIIRVQSLPVPLRPETDFGVVPGVCPYHETNTLDRGLCYLGVPYLRIHLTVSTSTAALSTLRAVWQSGPRQQR